MNSAIALPPTRLPCSQGVPGRELRPRPLSVESVCQIYWKQFYLFFRKKGYSHEDAEDLVQSFFAKMIKESTLSHYDRAKGSLSPFLLGSLKRHLTDTVRYHHRQKRLPEGGIIPTSGSSDLSADQQRDDSTDQKVLSMDQYFARAWVRELLARSHHEVRRRYRLAGKAIEFRLLQDALGSTRGIDITAVANQLRIKSASVRVLLHRMRRCYREAFRDELSRATGLRENIDAEIQQLLYSVSDS